MNVWFVFIDQWKKDTNILSVFSMKTGPVQLATITLLSCITKELVQHHNIQYPWWWWNLNQESKTCRKDLQHVCLHTEYSYFNRKESQKSLLCTNKQVKTARNKLSFTQIFRSVIWLEPESINRTGNGERKYESRKTKPYPTLPDGPYFSIYGWVWDATYRRWTQSVLTQRRHTSRPAAGVSGNNLWMRVWDHPKTGAPSQLLTMIAWGSTYTHTCIDTSVYFWTYTHTHEQICTCAYWHTRAAVTIEAESNL